MGLTPKGNAETDHPAAPEAYFQPFDLYGTRLARASLDVVVEGEKKISSLFSPTDYDGLMYLRFGSIEESEGGVLFAGYGIADDELGYNDYAALQQQGIDLSGMWVLMLRDEPMDTSPRNIAGWA